MSNPLHTLRPHVHKLSQCTQAYFPLNRNCMLCIFRHQRLLPVRPQVLPTSPMCAQTANLPIPYGTLPLGTDTACPDLADDIHGKQSNLLVQQQHLASVSHCLEPGAKVGGRRMEGARKVHGTLTEKLSPAMWNTDEGCSRVVTLLSEPIDLSVSMWALLESWQFSKPHGDKCRNLI